MKLWSYTIVSDTGLAPNPFGGCCTLAVCTPNHRGNNVGVGDWIMGHSTVDTDSRLIVLMQINEKMTFDDYYTCGRYDHKMPVDGGDWKNLAGDNFYSRDCTGKYVQHKPNMHNSKEAENNDLKKSHKKIVFISGSFYYFGKDCLEKKDLPDVYERLLFKTHGVKASHTPEDVREFINWMKANHETGRHADPRDADKRFPLKPTDIKCKRIC